MVKNFAENIWGERVSERWISRFLARHHQRLISKWSVAMDADRHLADSVLKYELYFELMSEKIQEYELEPSQIYNMDEKGFMLGHLGRSKRVFDKQSWEAKSIKAPLQDGSRTWITTIAAVCADGTALPPALIFASQNEEIRSSRVEQIGINHGVYVASSPSGWTNDSVGMSWLEGVFDRHTKSRSSRRRRLLILDGHGSHITPDLIQYCDTHRILLAILAPHSTHTLQPLDVGCFKPLAAAYADELTNWTHQSMGMPPAKKGDSLHLSWAAWQKAFTVDIIQSAFQATGLVPWDPEVVLSRFRRRAQDTQTDDNRAQTRGRQWPKIHTALREILGQIDEHGAGSAQGQAQFIGNSIHHLTAENEVLRHELEGVKKALYTKKRRSNKANTLPEPEDEPYYGGATFWSPKNFYRSFALREERALNAEAETAGLKAIEKELKQIQQQEARQKRAEDKVVRDAQRARESVEIDARKAARAAAAAAKRATVQQKGRQRSIAPKPRQKARTNKVAEAPEVGGGGPGPSTKSTRAGRQVSRPARFL